MVQLRTDSGQLISNVELANAEADMHFHQKAIGKDNAVVALRTNDIVGHGTEEAAKQQMAWFSGDTQVLGLHLL